MIDKLGRKIDYARISLTDRCNLSCVYCMPKGESIKFLPKSSLLKTNEIQKICMILASLGIQKIKLTGGEPLLRTDIIEIVQKINLIDGIKKITLTTNGFFLDEYFDDLYKNNIRDINISMDSLSPQKYEKITNHKLDKVINTLERIYSYKDMNIKLNAVPINIDKNDILELSDIARQKNIKVRFIEIMPIGYGKEFEFFSNEKILEILEEKYGKSTKSNIRHGNGPARYVSFNNFKSEIGFISAISHNFCHDCNRIRITCDGKLKPCLNFDPVLDIKNLLDENLDLDEIKEKISKAIFEKPRKHQFHKIEISNKDNRLMSQIGG